VFHLQTQLVLPNEVFFPIRVQSVQGTAELVFHKAAEYAGVSHWPWQVMDATHYHLRGEVTLSKAAAQSFVGTRKLKLEKPLPVVYEPRLVANLEVLIASFARMLSEYLVRTVNELPPGGASRWSQGIDLVAVFLGFGVVYANGLPHLCPDAVQKENHLSQWDITYALAIFCTLKKIPRREVLPHLKRPLRGFFNRAMVDVATRKKHLQELQLLGDPEALERHLA